MAASKKYDVLVLGAGITGLGAYLGLRAKNPLLRIAVVFDPSCKAISRFNPGITHEFPVDNYTRSKGSWGAAIAAEIWKYHSYSHLKMINLLEQYNLKFKVGNSCRQSADDFEKSEIEEACKELKTIFPNIRLQETNNQNTQVEQNAVAFFEPAKLEQKIWANIKNDPSCKIINRSITAIEQGYEGISIISKKSERILGEIAICGLHTGLASLIQELQDVLIPYSDQLHFYRVSRPLRPKYVSKKHGLLWKANCGRYQFFGGGRYLRPHAGIDEKFPSFEEKILSHIEHQFVNLNSATGEKKHLQGKLAFQEIRPCDELPIIGPMYNMDRLIISTGYMQRGFSLAIGAGISISELVFEGESRNLPRIFWPERLRGL